MVAAVRPPIRKASPGNSNGVAASKAPIEFERGDQVELAEQALAKLRKAGHAELVGDESALWGYAPATGLWTTVRRETQSRIVQAFAGATVECDQKPLRLRASDVSGAIALAYDRVADAGYFHEARTGVVFADSFVEVTANGVRQLQHSPANRARFGYPFTYPGNLPPTQFLRLLDGVFRDDDDRHEKIALLQEHAGASLVRQATTYQKCIVAIGAGGEGKSTVTKIMSAGFPPGSVEAIAPQEWGQEYRRAMLAGKLYNVVAELPEADIIASAAFKAIVTGDPIVGRHIRQAPFTFRPCAGHVFSANRLPGTADQTDAFWRRLAVIRFNRSFKDDPDRDPTIADTIIGDEIARVVAWMLEGAARLMRQTEYTLPASHSKELNEWRRNADQIATWLDEQTTNAPPGFGTHASSAYRAYRQWADINGHRAVSSTKFGMRLREMGKAAEHGRAGNVYPFAVKGCEGTVKGNPSRESVENPNACN